MRILSIAAIAALVFMVPIAHAEPGFSAAISIGNVIIEDEDSGVSFDSSAIGWKIFGKYTFNDHFSIEGGYIDFGEQDEDILNTRVEIDASGVDLFVVGSIPISEDFMFFGKLGMVSWDADLKISGMSTNDSGTDPAFGIGVAFGTSQRASIRLESEWFNISNTDTVWMISAGGEFRFR